MSNSNLNFYASEVFRAFFDYSTERIRVCARELRKEFFTSEVTKSALKFLKKSNTSLNIDLIVKNKKEADKIITSSSFLIKIYNSKYSKNKVQISFYKKGSKKQDQKYRGISIGDDKMYRYQNKKGTEAYKEYCGALVSFNDPEKVKKYEKRIDAALIDLELLDVYNY